MTLMRGMAAAHFAIAMVTLVVLEAGSAALAASPGEVLTGKVVSIADGDTFTMLVGSKHQVRVRLTEIDTPERGQPYAEKAKQELAGMIFGREVTMRSEGEDRYARTLGRVYVDGTDVNAEMVRSGAAWVFRKYARDPELFELERAAREAKRGLWALPEVERVPPWEWRRK